VREIYVSHTGDPVHAGDKALKRETPVQRGRVNRYVISVSTFKTTELLFYICKHYFLFMTLVDVYLRIL
jgi:hypothetical protein